MAKNTCIGIDIGSNRLKIAVKRRGELKRIISEPVPEGIMQDGHIISFDAMADFIRSKLRQSRVSEKMARLCIPIGEVFIRQADMPLMNVQQLKLNLPYEFHDFITEDMDKYIYDYVVLPDQKDDGMLHLIAVAAENKLINQYMAMARRAHIKLETIVPANVPLFNILSMYAKEQGIAFGTKDFAFLDLGDTSLKIHFFSKGVYEITRSMDCGMNLVSRQISEETGLDFHVSRLNLESNAHDIQASPYMADIYSDLASRIMRVMNFYNFNNRNNTLEELYYFGGGALISSFMDRIKEIVPLSLHSVSELLDGKTKLEENDILIGFQAIGLLM